MKITDPNKMNDYILKTKVRLKTNQFTLTKIQFNKKQIKTGHSLKT
jgi:hypothetical protein